ncbi:MAG: hypothetical protein ABI597_14080 [Gammaproteobacteria bacterium]
MFSLYSTKNWVLDRSYIEIEHGLKGELVPKKILKNQAARIQIELTPYRLIYEPCIPDDNNVRIDIQFAKNIPDDLIRLLEIDLENDSWLEKTANKRSFIFGIGDKKLEKYLCNLEDYILKNIDSDNTFLQRGFNELRDFVKLSKREEYLPLAEDDAISDDDLADSVFGEGYRFHRR